MAELDPSILEYYERGTEIDRLAGSFPSGPLELERTKELVLRHLPPGPLRVLDVGGGPGVYADWLATGGHTVRLIDPVPLHVEQAAARCPTVDAVLGDARALDERDHSFDAVLELGPLYHLVSRADRIRALEEARRVLRPAGILFAAAIGRHAALLDLLIRLDRVHEPDVAGRVREAVATGIFRGQVEGLFTTAYFHRPDELAEELAESGFGGVAIFNVEGPGFMVADFDARWADPTRREALLSAARLVERDPTMLGASSHLLAVARPARGRRGRNEPW